MIYWSVELPNVPTFNMADYEKNAEFDFSLRCGDLSTIKYWGRGSQEDNRVARHYWQCERTDEVAVSWRAECDAMFEESIKTIGVNYETGKDYPEAALWRQQFRDQRGDVRAARSTGVWRAPA